MKQQRDTRQQRTRKPGPPRRRALPLSAIVGLAAILVVGVVVALAWSSRKDGAGARVADSGAGTAVASVPALVAGVEVAQPVADAGRVPLNTPVERTWKLRNTGTTPVTLGKPSIAVLEGC